MPSIKKTFHLMEDDMVELSTENDFLKNKINSYDEKCLEESKARPLKQFNDDKRAYSILSKMRKQ